MWTALQKETKFPGKRKTSVTSAQFFNNLYMYNAVALNVSTMFCNLHHPTLESSPASLPCRFQICQIHNCISQFLEIILCVCLCVWVCVCSLLVLSLWRTWSDAPLHWIHGLVFSSNALCLLLPSTCDTTLQFPALSCNSPLQDKDCL